MTTNENQYLSLLRGINVGGNNIIKMSDLQACFENMGYTDVVTYIQSGNVLFKSDEKDKLKLIDKIEKELSEKFSYTSRIVVLNGEQLRKVVEEAPEGFGKEPDLYKYDVIFIKGPLTPKEALKDVGRKEGVDFTFEGKYVLYFSRLISQASKSYLSRIIKLPVYQSFTIRNWNTTKKLYELSKRNRDS